MIDERDADIEQPEPGENGRVGSGFGRGTNGARRAVRRRFDMASEIVVTERQQRCGEQIERENDLQPQAEGSAREPPGGRHPDRLYEAAGERCKTRRTALEDG